MLTPEALRAIHTGTGRSLAALFDHLDGLPAADLDRPFEGFGYPTVRLQLHHMLGAEHYWVSVLEGGLEVTEEDAYPDLPSLAGYRDEVRARTAGYLEGSSAEALNAPCTRTTWGGNERELLPAAVILRTQTHHFTHLGQILAMVRLMGHPARGLDYPFI